MDKAYTVEITVCPEYLRQQKSLLFSLLEMPEVRWTEEMRETADGLLNLLDAIEDKAGAD
jgi:hypothetical protein